jgi:ribulose-phosphate 3-epimerase
VKPLSLSVGVKSDPIECRYSYPWLLDLMAESGVSFLQLGTFAELYLLPDAFFADLRCQAEERGIHIRSVFTSHRELGGFFRDEPGWVEAARRAYERLIEIGAIVGADSVGSNPGSILRDRMDLKSWGIRTYLEHMKDLMAYAAGKGIGTLTMEPMSCLAEPPTLPSEMRHMMVELLDHRRLSNKPCARVGLCVDVAHGYVDAGRAVVHDHLDLVREALPWTVELHLKNADADYGATYGFGDAERERGVVDLASVRALIEERADELPVSELVGYLEIGGPKLGRDYSDPDLAGMLRSSLRHCRETFENGVAALVRTRTDVPSERERDTDRALLAPSVMCADMTRLGDVVRGLERAGADILHFDIMDASFAPNMPLGLGVLGALRGHTALAFDVHLMVMDPDFFVEKVAEIGAEYVSVHVEAARHLDRTLARIRGLGMKAGAALNPATPLGALEHVADRLDFVMLMTVNPGFAGQALVPAAMRKIGDCRQWLDSRGLDIPIEVDGNVSFANIPRMVALGARILVCGSSSLFSDTADLSANALRTRRAAAEGLREGAP